MAEIQGDKIVGIEEKPKKPKSNYAVTGIYMYDETVFDKTRTLKPSERGELEITDVNNAYIREGTMTYNYLSGWWTDAGTFDSLLRAANLVNETQQKRATLAWHSRGQALMSAAATALGSLESGIELIVPSSAPGIGKVILSPTSPDFIAGIE